MPLSDTTCRSIKHSATLKKLSDGGGLQFWVMPNGSKLWRLAYRFGGKQKLLAFGPYPELTLSDARVERDRAKRHLAKGVDPSEAKKKAKAERAETVNTFQTIAEEFLTQQRRNGRAAVTLQKAEWLMGIA